MASGSFTLATVDLRAIAHNVELLIARRNGAPYLADVRAHAFGHGDAAIAAASSAGAIASLDESVASSEFYGLAGDTELRPAMRISGRVVALKTIDAGEGVSYGYTYRALRRTNLALVSLGYADGLPRRAGNVATLQLAGKARLIAGRVAMNALVLELGDDSATLGDEAVVFGDPRNGDPSVALWAESVGASPAEAMTVFGAHLPIRYSTGRAR